MNKERDFPMIFSIEDFTLNDLGYNKKSDTLNGLKLEMSKIGE